MEPTTPNFVWTSDTAAWLVEMLARLGYSYRDFDTILGYPRSRGSYTRQVCERKLVPGPEYKGRLARWWNRYQYWIVVVPWLREREGKPVSERCYTRKRARIVRRYHYE